jgi:hypothetical protein
VQRLDRGLDRIAARRPERERLGQQRAAAGDGGVPADAVMLVEGDEAAVSGAECFASAVGERERAYSARASSPAVVGEAVGVGLVGLVGAGLEAVVRGGGLCAVAYVVNRAAARDREEPRAGRGGHSVNGPLS